MPAAKARGPRLALMAALLPVAWWTVQNGATLSLESRSPAVLAKAVPNSPAGLEVRAANLLAKPTPANRTRAATLLRQSLVQRIFSPQPIRLLGVAAGGLQYDPRSLPLFLLAEKTSRRDLPTQLYLISVDARGKRVKPALARMDRTLRVSKVGRQQLYPILAQQLSIPDSRQAIAQLVDGDTPWLPDFLSYVIDTDTPPEAIARTVVALGGYPVEEGRKTFEQGLLRSLNSRAQFEAMAELLPLLKAVPARLLTTAALNRETLDENSSPLAWQLGDNAAITVYTAIDADGDGSLAIGMAGGTSGLAARKLVLLEPGPHVLTVSQSSDSAEAGVDTKAARPEWTVACLDGDPPQQLLAFGGATVSGRFTVPAGCPMVQISLNVRSPDEATANISIDSVRID